MSSIRTEKKTRYVSPLYPIAAAVVSVLLLLLFFAAFCLFRPRLSLPELKIPVDPHAGQVLINDGVNEVWITPAVGVEPSVFTATDFRKAEELPVYVGSDAIAVQGIDVSEFQSPVDWQRVRADGIDFVILRCGGRTYGNGTLFTDEAFAENIRGAQNAGLDVGVYFFSQALTPQEAEEEAALTLSLLSERDIALPVFFDWERPADETARTRSLDIASLTDIACAFCDTIRSGGYTPGIYFNRQLGYYAYDWTRLADCVRWVADLCDWPDFYYASDFWQYSFDGKVDGINIQVDRDLMFVRSATDTDMQA